MNDLLSLFQNVPSDSTLTLFFDYTFKLEESSLEHAWRIFVKIIKWARAPTNKKEEKTEVKKDDNENQILFSLSYSLLTDNSVTADAVE
jgi:hypothetical protein